MIFEINQKPISVNRMRRGRTFLTPEYKNFKETARMEIWAKMVSLRIKMCEDEEMSVSIVFEATKPKIFDIDGGLKAVLDACTEAGLWKDDRYITKLLVTKVKSDKDRILIEIIK